MSFAQCADNGAELLSIASLPLRAIGQYHAHAVGAASRYIGKIPCCVTLAVPSVGIVDAAHYESVVVAEIGRASCRGRGVGCAGAVGAEGGATPCGAVWRWA